MAGLGENCHLADVPLCRESRSQQQRLGTWVSRGITDRNPLTLSWLVNWRISSFTESRGISNSSLILMYFFDILCKTSQKCPPHHSQTAGGKNQMQAYKSVGAMKSLVSEQPECALLLAEIFKGNFEICRRAPGRTS